MLCQSRRSNLEGAWRGGDGPGGKKAAQRLTRARDEDGSGAAWGDNEATGVRACMGRYHLLGAG